MNGAVVFAICSSILLQVHCSQTNQVPCGVPRNGYIDTILGGVKTDARDHPWHAALFHKVGSEGGWEYHCGGTLISERLVITVRHCTSDFSSDKLLVKLGSQSIDDLNAQNYTVTIVYTVNDGEWADFRNDIAVILLSEMVQFTRTILPACLPTQDVAVGEFGKVVGFGLTETNKTSQFLRTVSLPVVHPFECLRMHRDFCDKIDENQFCAGYTDGRTVCNGDSGSGIMILRNGTMQLGGMVSYAAKRPFADICREDGYGVFTSIFNYNPWINRKGIFAHYYQISIMKKVRKQKHNENIITVDIQPNDCGQISSWISWIAGIYIYEQKWFLSFVGTVINKRYVLTGYHNKIPTSSRLRVLLEKLELPHLHTEDFDKRLYRNVTQIIQHPNFHTFSKNNVILLRLENDIIFNENVQPVCLPTTAELNSPQLRVSLENRWKLGSFYFSKGSFSNTSHKCSKACEDFSKNSGLWCYKDPQSDAFRFGVLYDGSPIGVFSNQNGISRFIQLGARLILGKKKCHTFISYEENLEWILRNIEL